MTPEQQIAALRSALIHMLNAPPGKGIAALKAQNEARLQAHEAYRDTAPLHVQQAVVQFVAAHYRKELSYAQAVEDYGTSILAEVEAADAGAAA